MAQFYTRGQDHAGGMMLCCAVHMGSTRRTRVHGSFEKKTAHHIDLVLGFVRFFSFWGPFPDATGFWVWVSSNGFGFGFRVTLLGLDLGLGNGSGFGFRVTVLGLGLELLDPMRISAFRRR